MSTLTILFARGTDAEKVINTLPLPYKTLDDLRMDFGHTWTGKQRVRIDMAAEELSNELKSALLSIFVGGEIDRAYFTTQQNEKSHIYREWTLHGSWLRDVL